MNEDKAIEALKSMTPKDEIIIIGAGDTKNYARLIEQAGELGIAIKHVDDIKTVNKGDRERLGNIGIISHSGRIGPYERELVKVIDDQPSMPFVNPYAPPKYDLATKTRAFLPLSLRHKHKSELVDEYEKIKQKKSFLSRNERDAIVKFIESK